MDTIEYGGAAIREKICWELLLVLLCSFFFDGQILLVVSLVLIVQLTLPNIVLYKTKQSLWLFAIIMCLGILMNFYSGYNITLRETFRYVFYCISPVVYIYIGFVIKKKYSYYQCLKVIYIAALINCFKFAFVLINNISINGLSFDIIRSTKSETTILVAMAIFIYLLYKERYTFFTKPIDKAIFIVLLIVSVSSLSRTYLIYILIGVIIYIYIMRKSKNAQSWFWKTALLVGIFCIIIQSVPELNSILRDYMHILSISLQEVMAVQTWDIKNINESWRGFEIYMATDQFKKADVIQQILGSGSRGVYVGVNAVLVSDDAINGYIPILHNGYIAVLTYSGILGLALFVAFYIVNIRIGIKSLRVGCKQDSVLYIILFLGLAALTYFDMGPICPNGFIQLTIIIGVVRSRILETRNIMCKFVKSQKQNLLDKSPSLF